MHQYFRTCNNGSITSLGIAQPHIKGKYHHPDDFSISICSWHHEKIFFAILCRDFTPTFNPSSVPTLCARQSLSPCLLTLLMQGPGNCLFHFSMSPLFPMTRTHSNKKSFKEPGQELHQTRNPWNSLDRNSIKQEILERAWIGTPSNKKSLKEPGQELLQTRNLSKSLDKNSFKQEILERAWTGTPSNKKSLKQPGQELHQTRNPW